MKNILIATALLFAQYTVSAQTAAEVIQKIHDAQSKLKTISYSLVRQDTFVTGDTRMVTGKAKLQINKGDKIFGFDYWGKRDDFNSETIFDGNSVVQVDHDKKTYDINTSAVMIEHSTGSPGGQMVIEDLAFLDASKASELKLSQDSKNYYLIMDLPDLKEYDVTNRFKKFTIDKALMLPVKIIARQVTLGKVQSLNYTINDLKINDAAYAYNYSTQRFPDTYKPVVYSNKPSPLLNNPSPVFELTSFSNKAVSSRLLEGKVVLLDFWEVWCGPCIASMPKVDSLYEKYKSKGLEIYGIINDEKQVESSKLFMQKRKVAFQSLVGNKQVEKAFSVNGVPMYVLIDKKGTITFVSYGYSDKLEDEIKKLL